GEVRLRESLYALIGVLEAHLHALAPELIEDPLRNLGPGAVDPVEEHRELAVKGRTVLEQGGPQAIEDLDGDPLRVGRRLDHDRRHGADQYCLRHASRPVAPDVPGNLTAACGVTDEGDFL